MDVALFSPESEPLSTLCASNQFYRTGNVNQASRYIGSILTPQRFNVIGNRQVGDIYINNTELGGISLTYLRHGGNIRVRPESTKNFFVLQLLLRGATTVQVDGQEIQCNRLKALMISPQSSIDMLIHPDSETLNVKVQQADLERCLKLDFGCQTERSLVFTPSVSLATPRAKEVIDLLGFLLVSLKNQRGVAGSPVTREQLASLLLSSLLTCLDHNYSERLSNNLNRLAPACIVNAQEYIRNNLSENIGPSDIAEAAHLSPRALFRVFGRYLSTTPMRYLKNQRLDKVREALINMEPQTTSVTDVAMQFGFNHLGHFSAAYKERFQELPRETLNRKPAR